MKQILKDKNISNMLKKNSVFKIIFTLLVVLFILLVITNVLYTYMINNILYNWYVDSASSNASVMFQKTNETENRLNTLTYNLFSSNRAFLSYASELDTSNTNMSMANITMYDSLNNNNLSAIYVYRIKSDSITAHYSKSSHTLSENTIKEVVKNISGGNGWYFLPSDEGESEMQNGSLVYVTQNFAGFYVVYVLSHTELQDNFSDLASKTSDFIVYCNNNYLFDSSYLTTGTFTPQSFENFKFKSNSDGENYSANNKLYINNTNYRFSIVSIYDSREFANWKFPVLQNTIWLSIAIICIYCLVMLILYLLSKKKIMTFNNIITSNKSNTTNKLTALIKDAYSNLSVSTDTLNFLIPSFSEYVSYFCIMFQIDKLDSKNKTDEDIPDILKILYVDTVDLFSQHYNVTAAVCDFDTLSIFIANKSEVSTGDIIKLSETLSEQFKKRTNHTITTVLGDEFTNFANIYDNLIVLNTRKQYRFIMGYSSVICAENTHANYDITYPNEIETDLISAIIHTDHEACLRCTDSFFSLLIELNHPILSREWIATMCFSILRETQFLYNKSDRGFNFIKRIFSCNTMNECILVFQDMLPNIELLQPTVSSATTHFKRQVHDIIETEYKNPNLNISYISEKMGMTPAYWGQKFFKEFDSTFNAYLTSYRINKSLELLKNTNDKISDIGLQCGFSNGTYFAQVFFKHVGITPSNYRKTL